ncbi:phytoene/squalene synthase family protein [Corticibacterium sp. UT-5YL-CI-8]|nr:phytoene/squalene synthase family protein [Tianweitania sp. UT-5YL-CI-8]
MPSTDVDETVDPLQKAVREADRDRYISVLYAPEEKRRALLSLYAFNAEIASVRERVREPLPGEIRLQWWRDLIAADNLEGAGGSPLAVSLIETIRVHHLPREAFDNYLEARLFDLYDDPMPSRTDLEGYCGETASVMIQLAAMVLEPAAARTVAELAGHAGCAQAIIGLLRLQPIHQRRGQCYVPTDILAAAGTSVDQFLEDAASPSSRMALAAMRALAREHLAAFESGAKDLPQVLRPAFLPLALTRAYLDRLEKAGPSSAPAATDISMLRRHALMFRRAWRGW